MHITVYHNTARDGLERPLGMLDGYQPDHPITPVAAYEVEDDQATETTLGDAFRLFNVGGDPDYGEPDDRAVEYRHRGNRSLSVGDVVQVGDAFHAVESFGWRKVDQPRIEAITVYGTTPLDT